jgi:hypothetical protein
MLRYTYNACHALFYTTTRLVLGPTRPAIQWLSVTSSSELKGENGTMTIPFQLVQRFTRQRNTVAHSSTTRSYGKATMPFICIVVDFHVSVNNIKALSVAMKTQQCVFFALLSSYKIFRTAVNNIKVLRSSCKLLDIVVGFQTTL